MALYDMSTTGQIDEVKATTFAAEGVLERKHLQAALQTKPSLLGDDLLVLSEEYGDWADANRRIDLLCLDRDGRLVVVEIKRTADGGHMELQALRYAAMVSTMTYEHVERALRVHLKKTGRDADDADTILADWLSDIDLDETPIPSGEPRIVLVSAGFDKEITSAVLWLNRVSGVPGVSGLDIRCVKVTPYRVDERLLLDVQQVIPLPEAADYMVQLRHKEQAAKVSASSKDYTKFTITTADGAVRGPLAKRQALRAMVIALHTDGATVAQLHTVIPPIKLLSVDGTLTDDELVEAFLATHPKAEGNIGRWFFDTPIHEAGRTWVLSKMWGADTEATLGSLAKMSASGVTFAAVPHG